MSTPNRKRAAVVTPEKATKQPKIEEHDDDEGVTAATVMGFPKYPDVTNGDIMTNHYDFVVWAKKKKEEASGNLADFFEWVESPEGKRQEIEAEGREKFGFGKHNGKTFIEISEEDPGYHGRYMTMLRKRGEEPNPILSRYIDWFKRAGKRAAPTGRQARSRRVNINSSWHDDNQRFNCGMHSGQTFRQVAIEDPSCHLSCRATGFGQNEAMGRYVENFDQHGDHNAAARDERDELGSLIGIMPFECFGQYDSD